LFIGPSETGDRFECVMRAPAALIPGAYFLSVAIARPDEIESDKTSFYDFRFDAFQFHIIGTSRCFTTCLVDLNAELAVRPMLE